MITPWQPHEATVIGDGAKFIEHPDHPGDMDHLIPFVACSATSRLHHGDRVWVEPSPSGSNYAMLSRRRQHRPWYA